VTRLSFTVAAGEIVGLLGPNGAGKSTTLRLLAGRVLPTSGGATIAGRDLVNDALEARARVGWAPEEPPADRDLTPRGIVAYAAALRGLGRDATTWALEATDLAGTADQRLTTLSRGTRRRVGVALAIVHRPPVLLLDEPTAGLDPDQREAMHALLRAAADDGAAVLLSTHLIEDAQRLCDRILVLRGGTLVAEGARDGAPFADVYRKSAP